MRAIMLLLACLVIGTMLGGCGNPSELPADELLQPAADSTTSAVEISSETHEGC
jgi:hypothetical protein